MTRRGAATTPQRRVDVWCAILLWCGLWMLGSGCDSERALGIEFSSKAEGELIEVGARVRAPIVHEKEVDGSVPANEQFGALCDGLIEETPAFTLRLERAMPLRLVAESAPNNDLVMVVTGRYTTLCNDDFEGKNPGMQVFLRAGDYDVYVGSLDALNAPVPYRFTLEAADPNRPFQGLTRNLLDAALARRDAWTSAANPEDIQHLQTQIEVQQEAAKHDVPTQPPSMRNDAQYGHVQLEANVSGELVRIEDEMTANAALWPLEPRCGGYVQQEGPDVDIRVDRAFEGNVECHVEATSPVELAVHAPDGTWQCGGRVETTAATMEWEPWIRGDYRVFVVSTVPNATLDKALNCRSDGD